MILSFIDSRNMHDTDSSSTIVFRLGEITCAMLIDNTELSQYWMNHVISIPCINSQKTSTHDQSQHLS